MVNTPQLKRYKNLEALSAAAAEQFTLLAGEAVQVRGRFLVALSGGSTPLELFHKLARPPYRDSLPWAQTHVFWADERCVPPEDKESNYGEAYRAFLGPCEVPASNIHRVKGELEASAAAGDYARELGRFAAEGLAWPRFDLALLGMGADGHTASLFPGKIDPQEDSLPALAASGAYEGRPAQRVTLTPPVLNAARHVLFLVSGAGKAEALAGVLGQERDPLRWPAQRIRPEPGSLLWLVDEAAAGQL